MLNSRFGGAPDSPYRALDRKGGKTSPRQKEGRQTDGSAQQRRAFKSLTPEGPNPREAPTMRGPTTYAIVPRSNGATKRRHAQRQTLNILLQSSYIHYPPGCEGQ